MMRFGDDEVGGDGSRIEAAVDGVLDKTLDQKTYTRYPALTAGMHLFAYVKNID